jgi:hypothetical protein
VWFHYVVTSGASCRGTRCNGEADEAQELRDVLEGDAGRLGGGKDIECQGLANSMSQTESLYETSALQ